jgi:hypothetical protein
MKVMVVPFPEELVARGLAGDIDGDKPAIFDQPSDIPVYGRNADSVVEFLRLGKRFFRQEWSVGFGESLSNCLFLPGIPHS